MDILQSLRLDHRKLLGLLERLEAEVYDPARMSHAEESGVCARSLLGQLLERVAEHEKTEQRMLFPELKRRMPECERLLLDIEQEHEGMQRLLRELLEELPRTPQRPAFALIEHITRLANCLRSHILQEDSDFLSLAQDRIPAEVRRDLGAGT